MADEMKDEFKHDLAKTNAKVEEKVLDLRNAKWTGLYLSGELSKLFQFTCPCGVTVAYGLNEIPTVDTMHPCGNPNHYAVQFSKV